ncbi:MAG TPA: ABC transporter permease [Bryobacteraceae bacterium]|nr:ABC transporter permease [Bryobacteraceae bacterium]
MNSARAYAGPLRESRLLIALASMLVPRAKRAEWRAEWNAEMWHAWRLLQDRGEDGHAARRQLRRWSQGAFADGWWHRLEALDRERLLDEWRRRCQTPAFCLSAIGAVLGVIVLCSALLPVTRSVLFPLPYADAGRVATIAQGGVSLALRSGPILKWTRLWQTESRTVQEFATYTWRKSAIGGAPGLEAHVSARFFSLLGARTAAGRLWTGYGGDVCADCAVLSYDAAALRYGGAQAAIGKKIFIAGRLFRIAAVLPRGFWFLSRRIAAWTPSTPAEESDPWLRTGVVVRLAPDATPKLAETELLSIVRRNDSGLAWGCLVTVSPVQQRVRSVLMSFALGLLLASVIVLAGVHLRIPLFGSGAVRSGFCWRLGPFFAAKTVLAILAVLLAGLEFTPASSITMTGGTDLATEPISTWLFLVGCMGALSWSIHDQRRRCRVCVRRLGLCAHVGCSGCLLLNWAGTEMVCVEGHGMLHVPEMISSWNEPERWTALDESWQDLFVAR